MGIAQDKKSNNTTSEK